MERIKIKVNSREEKGKEAIKKLRKQGLVPAVVYSSDTNITLLIPSTSLNVLRLMHYSENAIIDMEIEGNAKIKTMPVFIKDIQFDPITDKVIHIDFLKVSLKEKIKVHVPIVLKGEAKGVKEDGGVLDQVLRDLEIEALPLDVPEKIEVDISGLKIGDSLHVENLTIPANVKVITDLKTTFVSVAAKEEEPEEEVVGAEGAPVEPEVIKEKKEEKAPGEEKKPKEQAKGEKKG